jgi:hypothetical protein
MFGFKRTIEPKTIDLCLLSQASEAQKKFEQKRQEALDWLGDKYLLANPVERKVKQ